MRRFFYTGILIVFAFMVFWKANVIQAKREAETISLFSQWARDGRPVRVETLSIGSLDEQLILSGNLEANGFVSTTIPPSWVSKVHDIQRCSERKGKHFKPCIQSVEMTPDSMTGLVSVKAFIPHDPQTPAGQILTASFVYKRRNVLRVPLSAVHREDGRTFVWKISNDRAIMQTIVLGQITRKFGEVLSGCIERDRVIVEGASPLRESDRVRVVLEDGSDHD